MSIRRWSVLVAIILLAACGDGTATPDPADRRPQIVTVPFDVVGQERGPEQVGRAFADSIVAGLRLVPELDAAVLDPGASSVRPTHLLSGTLSREGSGVRLRASLSTAHDDRIVWDSGDREIGTDLSTAASRVSREAVDAIGLGYPTLYPYIENLQIGPAMAASPLTARMLDARRRNDSEEWIAISRQLAEALPDDPVAHTHNAWALTLAWDAAPTPERLALLQERLLALGRVDPLSPYDELIRAYIYRSSGEPGQARVMYAWVLDGEAGLTNTARAWTLRQRALADLQVGDAEAARRNAEEAVALDPSKPQNLIALSKAFEASDRLDEAASNARLALALEPLNWRHLQRLGLIYARAGRYPEAIDALRSACDLGANQEVCANLAVTLVRSGDRAEAARAASYAETLNATTWGAYNLACHRALNGQHEVAIRDLQRAFELGFADTLIASDPDLDSLRQLSAFREIEAGITDRLTSRRRQSSTLFPWQS